MTPLPKRRYVVMVRGVDDSFEAYGVYRLLDRAQAVVDTVNRRIEQVESQHDTPDGISWAYVVALQEQTSVKDILARAGVPA